MAHIIQSIGKQFTVAFPAQSRVIDRFVHWLPTEILEPCFNVPTRNGDDHWIFRLSRLDSIRPTLLLHLDVPVSGWSGIRVYDDDQ